jgi:hypothetical protein
LWPTTAGSVKVVYTAGYSQTELRGQDALVDAGPIWEACVDEAVRRARKIFLQMKNSRVGWLSGPMTSENLGDYSYSVDASSISKLFGSATDLTTESKEKLSSFVNWGYALGG